MTMCLIVLNTLFAIKEIIQSNFGRRKGYFFSLWNVVDYLSIMFVYSYTFSTIAGGGIGTGNVTLAVFTTLLLTLVTLLSTWIQQHRMAFISASSEFPRCPGLHIDPPCHALRIHHGISNYLW
jgi:hypothetical protein